jgi:hypothetical protein
MKTTIQKLILALVLLGLQATVVVAEQTPEAVVSEMMAKIKAAGSPAPFIDYVNWPLAFKSAPEQMKAQMKVTSADQMKTTFQRMFTDTKAFFHEQMKDRLAAVPEDKRAMAEAQLEKMNQMIDQQQAQMKEQIQQTDYSVGKATVEGNSARVMLTQSYQGQTREREVQLTKEGGAWLLDSATIFQEQEQAKASAPAPSAPAQQPAAPAPQ